jgi:hypothetical protein
MSIRVKVKSQDNLRIRSSIAATRFKELEDIDLTNLQDGSVLVYSAESAKWESTRLLEKQTIECGQY